MRQSTIASRVRTFTRLREIEKVWLLPVWLLLGLTRFAVLTVPFRMIARFLGGAAGANACVPLIDGRGDRTARWIARTIQIAARYTPWDSNCLAQAIAARLLLGLYDVPCSLCLGIAITPQPRAIEAHAWVSAGRIRVTGGNAFEKFTVVGCFVDFRIRPQSGSVHAMS